MPNRTKFRYNLKPYSLLKLYKYNSYTIKTNKIKLEILNAKENIHDIVNYI